MNQTTRAGLKAGSAVGIETLDFLRGVAAIYVLINHTRGAFFAGGRHILEGGHATWLDYLGIAMLQATSLGNEFVILFFVISGFSMANSLSRSQSIGRFYLKRIIRIWPPFIAAVLIAVTVCFAMQAMHPADETAIACAKDLCRPARIAQILFYITPSTTLTVQFWSLPHEILFYAICPIALRNRRSAMIAAMIAATLTVIGISFFGLELMPARNVLIDFSINALLFFIVGATSFYFFEYIPRIKALILLPLLGVLLALCWGLKLYLGFANIISSISMTAICILLLKNLNSGNWFIKRLNFGKFSYSIYLIHYQIIMLISFILLNYFGISKFEIRNYLAWALVVPPLLFFCWLFYLAVEQHCNRIVAKLRSPSQPIGVSGP